MYDFEEVVGTTKGQQIRAWCIEQSIESHQVGAQMTTTESIINRASKIEAYITNGATS